MPVVHPSARMAAAANSVERTGSRHDRRQRRSERVFSSGDRKTNRWHLQIADRWVVQYLTRAALKSCSVPTKTAAFGSVPTVDLSSRAL
jgi:hypothetical protein